MAQISYFGQPYSYFLYLSKIQEILDKFNFQADRISCNYDNKYDVGTEEYVIDGDGTTFTITITPEGAIYCLVDDKNEYIGTVDDKPEETSHYIDVMLNGPTEDLTTLFEGFLREDKQSELYDAFNSLDIDWGNEVNDESFKKDIFTQLFKKDVTPTKKYLPWVISQGKEFKKLDWVSTLNAMVKVSELMSFIEKRVSKGDVEELQQRLKTGDLQNFGLSYDRIVKAPKDINSYPDLNSMREFQNQIKQRAFSSDELKNAKKESKKLYEDSTYLIVQPLSYQASCVYGAETKWCVSQRDNSTYFNDYTKNSKFVYVINKKGTNRQTSKFALRIPEVGKPEVWNQQDSRVTFDELYNAMPGISEILLNILNIGGTDYTMLLKHKQGKSDVSFNVNDRDESFEIIDDNLFIYFDGDFFKLFKNQLYSYNIDMLESFTSSRYGRQTEWMDYYAAEEDWKDGYVLSSMDNGNKEKLDNIIKLISPSTFSEKLSDNKDYYKNCSTILTAQEKFTDRMTEEYQMANDQAITAGLEDAVNTEYCNILSEIGISTKTCFTKYYTTVDNMLELYEKYGNTQRSIKSTITSAINDEISVDDIFEYYYEYKDNDTFDSNFNTNASSLLDDLLEKFTDNDDGFFDDIDEYQKIVDYIVNKIGFNISIDLPEQENIKMTILGVNNDNTILIKIGKTILYSERVTKYNISFEQLISLLKNYQLFEI